MAETSVVDFIYVKKEQRLDAEYYRPIFLSIEEKLSKNSKCLFYWVDYIRTITPSLDEYCEKGIPVIKLKNVRDFFIDFNDLSYIPESLLPKFAVVKKWDLLITATGFGTVGRSALYDMNKTAIVTGELLLLRKKAENINMFYLVTFLNSKYGKSQIERQVTGATGQTHLLWSRVKNIKIFESTEKFQEHIGKLVKQTYEKMKLSEQKYQQAEELLYKLLGIPKEEIEQLEKKISYETNFKNVVEAFRFDAEYYHPRYLGIVELLRRSSFEVKPLREVVTISDEKIDPTNEENKMKRFRYVPIAKINESGEIFEWDEFYGWQAPSRARMLIKKGDIIIPSLAGTFDKIALVPEELNNQLTTTGCFVIRAKEDYPEFLFLLLRTPFFKRQLEQQTTGAIMSAVPKSKFGDLLIPKIPKDKQDEITRLIRKYFELRKEARNQIKRAIKEVEEVIENASSKWAVRK